MANSGHNRTPAAENVALKIKVNELEGQVTEYRKRLNDLRKAKNTTVVKRERELLEINAPNLGKREDLDGRLLELENRLRESEKTNKQTIEDLKTKHTEELECLQKCKPKELECGHEEELRQLKLKIEDLANDKTVLLSENCDLTDRIQNLITELSIKEAHWCEQEEQMKIKMQMQFGDKYKEWMEETEKRMEELQSTNLLLRQYIKKEKPGSGGHSSDG